MKSKILNKKIIRINKNKTFKMKYQMSNFQMKFMIFNNLKHIVLIKIISRKIILKKNFKLIKK